MPVIAWWLLAGGAAALLGGGGVYLGAEGTADAAKQTGIAAQKATGLAEVAVAGLAIFYGYKVAKGAGWIK